MSTSKVAYLSKYITTATSESNNDQHHNGRGKSRKHGDKKSKKIRRQQQQEDRHETTTDHLIDIDNDIDILTTITGKQRDKNNGEGNSSSDELLDDDDDEPPVVVGDIENSNDFAVQGEQHVPRGTWESESPTVDQQLPPANSSQKHYQPHKRRRRHDSDTTSEPNDIDTSRVHSHRRHDSSSDNGSDTNRNKKRSETSRQHRRNDSSKSESNKNQQHPWHGRQRHDSDDSDEDRAPSTNKHSRRRHDSASDDSKEEDNNHQHYQNSSDRRKNQRKRHNSSESSDNETDLRRSQPPSAARMSSGHKAGIQTSTDFTRREEKLQRRKKYEAHEFVRKHGTGSETIYRDRESGKKLDHPPPQQQQRHDRKTQIVLTADEQRILNSGRVQLEQQEQVQHEFKKIQESAFARHRDDTELDTKLKNIIHPDDPMAAYAIKKGKQTSHLTDGELTLSQQQQQKQIERPVYKGPPPKPNRFGIPPGYRWDARDRGNGFEDKLLAKQYNSDHQKEQAYRYSAADM